MTGGTDISNGILAAGPSRVSIRRKATADIGAPRSQRRQGVSAAGDLGAVI
jgi:hypothetical protein